MHSLGRAPTLQTALNTDTEIKRKSNKLKRGGGGGSQGKKKLLEPGKGRGRRC